MILPRGHETQLALNLIKHGYPNQLTRRDVSSKQHREEDDEEGLFQGLEPEIKNGSPFGDKDKVGKEERTTEPEYFHGLPLWSIITSISLLIVLLLVGLLILKKSRSRNQRIKLNASIYEGHEMQPSDSSHKNGTNLTKSKTILNLKDKVVMFPFKGDEGPSNSKKVSKRSEQAKENDTIAPSPTPTTTLLQSEGKDIPTDSWDQYMTIITEAEHLTFDDMPCTTHTHSSEDLTNHNKTHRHHPSLLSHYFLATMNSLNKVEPVKEKSFNSASTSNLQFNSLPKNHMSLDCYQPSYYGHDNNHRDPDDDDLDYPSELYPPKLPFQLSNNSSAKSLPLFKPQPSFKRTQTTLELSKGKTRSTSLAAIFNPKQSTKRNLIQPRPSNLDQTNHCQENTDSDQDYFNSSPKGLKSVYNQHHQIRRRASLASTPTYHQPIQS